MAPFLLVSCFIADILENNSLGANKWYKENGTKSYRLIEIVFLDRLPHLLRDTEREGVKQVSV